MRAAERMSGLRQHSVQVRALGARWRGALTWLSGSATCVALVTLLVYGGWTLHYLSDQHHNAQDFILVGRSFAHPSHPSPLLRFGPDFHYGPLVGYDGQFCYFIAVDPVGAPAYIDRPAYRYTRILYPMAARLLALGQPERIPATLLIVNLLALTGGVWALGAWLRRRGLSPWLALLYGLYSGLFIAYQRDLTEPLSYGLVALAVYLFDFGGRRRLWWAGGAFALAILARETAALFTIVYAGALLFEGTPSGNRWVGLTPRLRRAALFGGLAVAPLAAYKLFLMAWLGSSGARIEFAPHLLPFEGLFAYWPFTFEQITILQVVLLPALICAGLGVWALRRRMGSAPVWALLSHVLLFVVLLSPASYVDFGATGRVTSGVVLAALYCLPTFDRLTQRSRIWLAICAPLWLKVTVDILLIGRVV